MTENSSNIKDTVEIVKGIVEAVPVYQDIAQPAAKEIGTALATIAKCIHIVLAPISLMLWGYDQLKEFLSTKVAEKLSNTPPEDIIEPAPHVAVPVLQALQYSGNDPDLSEMYANLLAAAMDRQTANSVHPSFVEIIKQLSPPEAQLLQKLCEAKTRPFVTVTRKSKDNLLGSTAFFRRFSLFIPYISHEQHERDLAQLDNLARLSLIEIRDDTWYAKENTYDLLLNHPVVGLYQNAINSNESFRAEIDKGSITITSFGKNFYDTCVKNHKNTRAPVDSST